MITIQYQTGRDYGTPQVLEITLPALPADELADVSVSFADAARGIAGTVVLMAMEANRSDIGRAVLREYDAGRYTVAAPAAAPAAAAWITEAKAWARENYTKGADTMVECWSTSDYQDVWTEAGSDAKAWKMVKTLCSIWSERQADARSYREC